MEHGRWLVVGGGFLGASTTIRLKELFPEEKIIWVLGGRAEFASADMNKIIRTTYADPLYCQFAEHALERWRTDEALKPFFHPTGWIQTISPNSYRSTKKTSSDQPVSLKDFAAQCGLDAEQPPRLEEGEELWYNPAFGSIDGAEALQMLISRAQYLGVVTIQQDVQRLLVNEKQACTGAELADGRTVSATETILSAGVWTPGILKQSGIHFRDHFFDTVGVVVASFPLSESELNRLRGMPILVTEFGEIMLSVSQCRLKVTTTETFLMDDPRNVHAHPHRSETGPNRKVLHKMMPEFAERELEPWICMDLMTADQRPLIDRVEGVSELCIATGGNYHSAKFVNFGDLVVRKVTRGDVPGADLGLLDDILLGCRWDRMSEAKSLHPGVVPKHKT